MSRFYSVRSQTNTSSGGDIESFQSLNTLADSYVLGRQKMDYLQENFRRLHGRDPNPVVFRYKGQFPGMEAAYDNMFNNEKTRWTQEDYRLMGETMYKASKGLASARWDKLDEVHEMLKVDQKQNSRFYFANWLLNNDLQGARGKVWGPMNAGAQNPLATNEAMKSAWLAEHRMAVDNAALYDQKYGQAYGNWLRGVGMNPNNLGYIGNYDTGQTNWMPAGFSQYNRPLKQTDLNDGQNQEQSVPNRLPAPAAPAAPV